jgi:hypothetical protein
VSVLVSTSQGTRNTTTTKGTQGQNAVPVSLWTPFTLTLAKAQMDQPVLHALDSTRIPLTLCCARRISLTLTNCVFNATMNAH